MVADISRQAYYKSCTKKIENDNNNKKVIELALEVRIKHPKMSCKKIYHLISNKIKSFGIKMGRDKFISLMVKSGYTVPRKRRYKHKSIEETKKIYHPNLIKHLEIKAADQVWVNDITYITTSQGFLYLSLVTDAYTRYIIGYALGDDLSTKYCMEALQMAINTTKLGKEVIHHSDRGTQYSSEVFNKFLNDNHISGSMTKGGSPQENAIAERINGILKEEYGISDRYITKKQCHKLVEEVINLYNTERPHLSLGMQTPLEYYNNYYKNLEQN